MTELDVITKLVRLIGTLEGASYVIDNGNISDMLLDSVETLNSIVNHLAEKITVI